MAEFVANVMTSFVGFVNAFLSWEGFLPLARLSFNVYLIHFNWIRVLAKLFAYPVVISHFLMAFFLSFFVFSLVAAFLVSVAVEMPLISCEKYVFKVVNKLSCGSKQV